MDLFHLNGGETVDFAASRLRGAARQWWNALGTAGKAPLVDTASLAGALRTRFQPVTSERTAREQLRSLRQGSRGINEYIADFQRLQALLPDMAQSDALFAFESGLNANLAVELRKQGTNTVQDAIALTARIGGLLQATAASGQQQRGMPVNQLDAANDEDNTNRLDRLEAALNALVTRGPGDTATGTGARTQDRWNRPRQNDPNGGATRGGRDNRGGRSGRFGGGSREPIAVPGVPPAVVQQRLDAKQCLRCGDSNHRSIACPNAISASGN